LIKEVDEEENMDMKQAEEKEMEGD